MRTVTMIVLVDLLAIGQARSVAAVPGAAARDESHLTTERPEIKAGLRSSERLVESNQSGNPLWAVPLHELSATTGRPLFAATRRPPSPPPAIGMSLAAEAPPKPVEPERPQLSLLGTVTGGEGARGIGIFLDQVAKRVMRLKLGEQHNGWAVREVQSGQVELEKGRERVVLTLPPPETKGPAPALPAQPVSAEAPPAPRPPAAPSKHAAATEGAFDWSKVLKQGEAGSPQ